LSITANLGPYAAFILTAYAAAFFIVAGLVVWIMLDRRRLLRLIGEIEAQGPIRRAQQETKKRT
jgi:heme exporter protein CcmD